MPSLLLFLHLLGCGSNPTKTNWVVDFEANPAETLIKINHLTDKSLSDMVHIQLLQEFPTQAGIICENAYSSPVKEYCDRFLSRPHLWTIKPEEEILVWRGGVLNERVLFPNLSVPTTTEPTCDFDDISCISSQIKEALSLQNYNLIDGACKSHSTERGRNDCFFSTAENVALKHGGYQLPVSLCQKSGTFSSECHHHVLLGLAIRNQLDEKRHLGIIQEVSSYWSSYPQYSEHLTNLYWAIVASRVAGVVQPFRWEEWSFLPTNHLNSALALRLVREQAPLDVLRDLFIQEEYYLEKSYGPGTPHFQPTQIWSEVSKPTLYFCDIRGGRRPVHVDQQTDIYLALITAAAMMKPPNDELIRRILDEKIQLATYANGLINEL